jgi:hypothetical protein
MEIEAEMRKEIQERLQDVAKENGDRALSATEWKHQGYRPSVATIQKYFGRWSAAWESVGYKTTVYQLKDHTVLTDEQILEKMREVGPKSITEWKRGGYEPSVNTIRSRFRSWVTAWEKAGFPYSTRILSHPDKEEILAVARKLGRFHSQAEWKRGDYQPSINTVIRCFGSWGQMWKEAGFPETRWNLDQDKIQAVKKEDGIPERQLQILDMLMEGRRVEEIAKEVKVSRAWIYNVAARFRYRA